MSKDKPKIKYIDFRTFGGIYIGLAKTQKKFFKECKRLNIPKDQLDCEIRACRLWRFTSKDKMTLILSLNEELVKDITIIQLYGLFVHEAVHAWQYVCEHIGEYKSGSEMEAYHTQEIWHKFVEIYEGK